MELFIIIFFIWVIVDHYSYEKGKEESERRARYHERFMREWEEEKKGKG